MRLEGATEPVPVRYSSREALLEELRHQPELEGFRVEPHPTLGDVAVVPRKPCAPALAPYLELDADGRIAYAREAAEPLFKPGAVTERLLKAVTAAAKDQPRAAPSYAPRTPTTAAAVGPPICGRGT